MKWQFAITASVPIHFAQAEPLYVNDYETMFAERADEVVDSKPGERLLELDNGVSVTSKMVSGVQEYTAFDSSGHIPVGCLVQGLQVELAVVEACPEKIPDYHAKLLMSLADKLLIFYAENSVPPQDLQKIKTRLNVGLKATAHAISRKRYCAGIEVSEEIMDEAYLKLDEAVEQSIALPRLPVRSPCGPSVGRDQ
ncbi:hypothetical protein [Roseovarius aestuarii]|uniref:Uncharacterized protein n=1 Tax=Roseovarius aestuarii TaxID=475083 RepID=A0A1X7BTE1_9RHOB|nr:hypothetical protein [Roseovarius aestuarii]SMC12936.1 hypothetical protein ROA7745_02769 [Roseovarius aestuarii]